MRSRANFGETAVFSIGSMRSDCHRPLWVLGIAYLTIGLGRAVCAQDAIPVRTIPIEKQTVNETVVVWGIVEQNLQQLYFEVNGYVTELLVKDGDLVESQQLLARLDTILISNERAQAEVAAQHAEVKLARTETLKRNKAVGQDELDDATNDYRLKVLKREKAEKEYRKYFLRAPENGQILTRFLDFPGPATTSTPIFAIKPASRPWIVTFKVAEHYIQYLSMGDTVEVYFTVFKKKPLHGKVVKIAMGSESEDHLFEVDVALQTSPDFLRAGMRAKAYLSVAQHTGYAIPLNAFERLSGKKGTLFVTDQTEQKAHRVDVTFSIIKGSNAIISNDLSAYNSLITKGMRDLKEGTLIQVITLPLCGRLDGC